MTTLEDLTRKYDVDALELGYTKHYHDILEEERYNIGKVLEIGVETGRSHRMWLEYFENATVYGYDIFEYGVDEFNKLQEGNPYLDRSVMFKGDQSNTDDLKRYISENGGEFDMIIDDGGHTMEQMQVSLNYLWDEVKSGGLYVIEDLHSCSGEWPHLYGYEVIKSVDTLTTDLLYSIENNDETITETNYISKERLSDIKSQVKWCRTKIGVDSYTNPKGYTYKWPTMLAFIRKL